jgi:hypothetical protein
MSVRDLRRDAERSDNTTTALVSEIASLRSSMRTNTSAIAALASRPAIAPIDLSTLERRIDALESEVGISFGVVSSAAGLGGEICRLRTCVNNLIFTLQRYLGPFAPSSSPLLLTCSS